jgi:hypothetical protein
MINPKQARTVKNAVNFISLLQPTGVGVLSRLAAAACLVLVNPFVFSKNNNVERDGIRTHIDLPAR